MSPDSNRTVSGREVLVLVRLPDDQAVVDDRTHCRSNDLEQQVQPRRASPSSTAGPAATACGTRSCSQIRTPGPCGTAPGPGSGRLLNECRACAHAGSWTGVVDTVLCTGPGLVDCVVVVFLCSCSFTRSRNSVAGVQIPPGELPVASGSVCGSRSGPSGHLSRRHMAQGTVKWFQLGEGLRLHLPDDGGADCSCHLLADPGLAASSRSRRNQRVQFGSARARGPAGPGRQRRLSHDAAIPRPVASAAGRDPCLAEVGRHDVVRQPVALLPVLRLWVRACGWLGTLVSVSETKRETTPAAAPVVPAEAETRSTIRTGRSRTSTAQPSRSLHTSMRSRP